MGTACCAMELIAASFSKFDFDRLGTFPRPDPRHTDVMILAGTITEKMKPAVQRLYDQMPDPKWVIAMGNCTVSGGIFYYDTYSVVRGADEFLPVDVYIGGCPPRPESLQDGILQLRELVKTESIAPGKRRERALTPARAVPTRRTTAVTDRVTAARSCSSRARRALAACSCPLFSLEFGDAVIGVEPRTSCSRPRAELKELGFDRLGMVTAVDRGEFLEMVYRLQSRSLSVGALPEDARSCRDEPRIDSLCDLWPAADWQEREVYDLFGIVFDGPSRPAAHPAARRLRGPPAAQGLRRPAHDPAAGLHLRGEGRSDARDRVAHASVSPRTAFPSRSSSSTSARRTRRRTASAASSCTSTATSWSRPT